MLGDRLVGRRLDQGRVDEMVILLGRVLIRAGARRGLRPEARPA
ncbi:MAG TPA: hypothetical protein VMW47_10430 [Verrucomicrobiae bacterium]|nr:hypothetical protein [Verrucomicrobiae bacterium]